MNDPTGKPQRTIPDVLGPIALVYQRKAELQAREAHEKLAQLQLDNSRLRGSRVAPCRRFGDMPELRNRPGRTPEVDARVLGIEATKNTDLVLEGNELSRVKTACAHFPARQQNGQQGQGTELKNMGSLNNATSLNREGKLIRVPNREVGLVPNPKTT